MPAPVVVHRRPMRTVSPAALFQGYSAGALVGRERKLRFQAAVQVPQTKKLFFANNEEVAK